MNAPVPGVAVEMATWPPLERIDVAGWLVGVSGGLTKRANSAVPPTAPDGAADVTAVEAVEEVYAAHGLPSTVRLSPERHPDLDRTLAGRGYRAVGTTEVLVAPLTGAGSPLPAAQPPGLTCELTPEPGDAWLALWLSTRDGDLELARRLLRSCPAGYLDARDEHGVAGVARVAVVDGWAAISCVTVAARARRAGVGRAVVGEALATGADLGAQHAFVQVEVDNVPAQALYAGLGFTTVDRYHYRRADTPAR